MPRGPAAPQRPDETTEDYQKRLQLNEYHRKRRQQQKQQQKQQDELKQQRLRDQKAASKRRIREQQKMSSSSSAPGPPLTPEPSINLYGSIVSQAMANQDPEGALEIARMASGVFKENESAQKAKHDAEGAKHSCEAVKTAVGYCSKSTDQKHSEEMIGILAASMTPSKLCFDEEDDNLDVKPAGKPTRKPTPVKTAAKPFLSKPSPIKSASLKNIDCFSPIPEALSKDEDEDDEDNHDDRNAVLSTDEEDEEDGEDEEEEEDEQTYMVRMPNGNDIRFNLPKSMTVQDLKYDGDGEKVIFTGNRQAFSLNVPSDFVGNLQQNLNATGVVAQLTATAASARSSAAAGDAGSLTARSSTPVPRLPVAHPTLLLPGRSQLLVVVPVVLVAHQMLPGRSRLPAPSPLQLEVVLLLLLPGQSPLLVPQRVRVLLLALPVLLPLVRSPL
jgi:hypothetical protein